MRAPEVRVRVEHGEAPVWWWRCDTCHRAGSPHVSRDAADLERVTHAAQCGDLARLQARWDARDKAERALIEKWRERQAKHSGFYGESSLADGYEICADELERAIGGGK